MTNKKKIRTVLKAMRKRQDIFREQPVSPQSLRDIKALLEGIIFILELRYNRKRKHR